MVRKRFYEDHFLTGLADIHRLILSFLDESPTIEGESEHPLKLENDLANLG